MPEIVPCPECKAPTYTEPDMSGGLRRRLAGAYSSYLEATARAERAEARVAELEKTMKAIASGAVWNAREAASFELGLPSPAEDPSQYAAPPSADPVATFDAWAAGRKLPDVDAERAEVRAEDSVGTAPVGTSLNPTEAARNDPDAWLGPDPRERLLHATPVRPASPNEGGEP